MKMNSKLPFLAAMVAVILTLTGSRLFAQETSVSAEAADSLNNKIENVKSDLELLKRLNPDSAIEIFSKFMPRNSNA